MHKRKTSHLSLHIPALTFLELHSKEKQQQQEKLMLDHCQGHN